MLINTHAGERDDCAERRKKKSERLASLAQEFSKRVHATDAGNFTLRFNDGTAQGGLVRATITRKGYSIKGAGLSDTGTSTNPEVVRDALAYAVARQVLATGEFRYG